MTDRLVATVKHRNYRSAGSGLPDCVRTNHRTNFCLGVGICSGSIASVSTRSIAGVSACGIAGISACAIAGVSTCGITNIGTTDIADTRTAAIAAIVAPSHSW
jgi:hypothetical protein